MIISLENVIVHQDSLVQFVLKHVMSSTNGVLIVRTIAIVSMEDFAIQLPENVNGNYDASWNTCNMQIFFFLVLLDILVKIVLTNVRKANTVQDALEIVCAKMMLCAIGQLVHVCVLMDTVASNVKSENVHQADMDLKNVTNNVCVTATTPSDVILRMGHANANQSVFFSHLCCILSDCSIIEGFQRFMFQAMSTSVLWSRL